MDDSTKTTEDCTSTKRQIKMTEKAKEEKLLRLVQSRKAKLAQLTSKSKEIEQLMDDAAHVDAAQLVRSCLHMNPAEGYLKAKQLLREHFGNEYQIAVAYMNKALEWPSIRPEDGEALHSFSFFLSGCCNAMSDISYMEEMDNAANLRAIAVKLPYKLREKWRSVACGIQEKQNARVKFKDLVDFINKQARISLHPVFGDIKETSTTKGQSKLHAEAGIYKRAVTKRVFTTSAVPIDKKVEDDDKLSVQRLQNTRVDSQKKPCVFCKGLQHNLESCKRLKSKTHQEKIDFLRSKGLCFGCLKHGHVSKQCKDRMSCSQCSLPHPTILHMKPKECLPEDKTDSCDRQSVTSALVYAEKDTSGDKDTCENECTLSIVPVQVKTTKGTHLVKTYAFLDPGSSDTFCTEALMSELKVNGRRTDILLRTMGDEKQVKTHIVSGLEISSLDQGSPNLILEGLCPAEFSSNLPQHTSLEVSSIPSKTLISCFRCV